jgi:dsRNA-specific ribonuclease
MSTTADQQPVLQVTEDDAARLQAENPKGRLLEWCAKEKWASPQFEQEAVPGGFRIRGILSPDTVEQTHKQFVVPPLGGLEATTTAKQPPEGGMTNGLTTHLCGGCEETIATAWYGAAKLKAGEQAAAEAILQLLQRRQTTRRPQPPSKTAPPSLPVNRNAAMLLNELTQAGVLQATGYDVVDQSGPSHQPTFTVVAWATTAAGQTLRTEAVCASSKKSAQRTAADQLLDLLAQEGITRIRETSA